MNSIKNYYFILCLVFSASIFTSASAAEYDPGELDAIIAATQAAEGLEDLSVAAVLFARGIQSYQLTEAGWAGAGPLAKLYLAENGVIGDEKIGTHYAHLPTPAWEVEEGRVVAESAAAIPKDTVNDIEIGADDEDVAWLNVKLQPNDFGLKRILRVVTTSGISPRDVDNYKQGAYIGVGYTTFYVFLK